MLGRRHPQRSLFEAPAWPHPIPSDSFYARLAAVNEILFRDEDLAELYCPDNGRPSLPPSLLSGVTLLQFYDNVSDQEAVERTCFDLRWKVALHLPLDFAGFDPSCLLYFRKRLVEHHQERYAFDRLITVARTAGFLPDKLTLLTDTTWVKGAGAVQDTYTLIRKAIRKLVRQMGYALPAKRRGLAPQIQQLLATYLEQDRKADIDWTDPQQRAAQLKVLVQDAEATSELAVAQADDPDVQSTGWLLTKILSDDVVTDEHGDPQIGEGTAPDRIISVTDPEMRHGHKSQARRFDGFKTAVATEVESELILDVADLPATHGDGEHLMPTVARVEELVGPLARPPDPAVAKSAFQIDCDARRATCPGGHSVAGTPTRLHGRATIEYRFPRQTCETCRFFDRCVHGKVQGRTVRTDDFDPYRQAARQRQATVEFKALYRMRSRVERKQAELIEEAQRDLRALFQRGVPRVPSPAAR